MVPETILARFYQAGPIAVPRESLVLTTCLRDHTNKRLFAFAFSVTMSGANGALELDLNYRSSEDEDYVYEEDDEEQEARVALAKLKKKSTYKKVGGSAAVLSSSDEDEPGFGGASTAAGQRSKRGREGEGDVGGLDDDWLEDEEEIDANALDDLMEDMNADDPVQALMRQRKQAAYQASSSSSSAAASGGALPPAKRQKTLNSWEVKPKKSVREMLAEEKRKLADMSAPSSSSSSAATTAAANSSAATLAKDESVIQITETVKFAGQQQIVERKLVKGSAEELAYQEQLAAKAKQSNLASILDDLKEKRKINTVEKSRFDWTKDKEFTGDQDELEHKAKNGVLGQKDFLQAMDVKQFEIQKANRVVQRSLAKKQEK
jgi:hypothetical protein